MKETFQFSSDLVSLNLVEKVVDQLTDMYNINSELYGNIIISVHEAVKNAIIHGNDFDVLKKVTFVYEIQDKSLIFTISDEGNGFDIHSLPDPTTPENIEEPTGRGIFLISNLTDNFEFLNQGKTIKLFFEL